MKNSAGLIFLTVTLSLGYSCSKEDSDKAPEPGEMNAPNAPIVPTPPVIPPAPAGPNTPEQPEPTPIPANDTANSGEIKLAPLPPNGVPAGYLSWDEFNSKDPASRSLVILDGSDPVQEDLGENPLCSVYVLAAYLNEKFEPTYVLRTSFKHNEQSHPWISVSLGKDQNRVTGTGSNGQDQIFLQLVQPGDLFTATRMNLKWFHINHFDTGVCENLKRRPRS